MWCRCPKCGKGWDNFEQRSDLRCPACATPPQPTSQSPHFPATNTFGFFTRFSPEDMADFLGHVSPDYLDALRRYGARHASSTGHPTTEGNTISPPRAGSFADATRCPKCKGPTIVLRITADPRSKKKRAKPVKTGYTRICPDCVHGDESEPQEP